VIATTPTASPQETAAIVAAIEQFARDTAPPARPAARAGDPWLRAARLEDAGEPANAALAWGDPHPWGRHPT